MPWIAPFIVALTLRGAPVVPVASAQNNFPFAREIAAFREMDRKNPPAKGQTLFIGSSSFTKWTDAQSYFPTHKILNRAYGGSRLLDEIQTVNDVVFPYAPKQVVIYCGENDVASDPKLAAFQVVDRFKALYGRIRVRLPKVPITYVSMKPCPSRWKYRAKFIAANRWIREFCEAQPNADFVDVWDAMLDASGHPRKEIFLSDDLHMNAAGYRIWAPLIEPHLK